MVGYNLGTVSDCIVTIESGKTIYAAGGALKGSGGVVGYNVGTVYNNCTSDYKPAIGGGNTTPAPLSGEGGQQNVTVIS